MVFLKHNTFAFRVWMNMCLIFTLFNPLLVEAASNPGHDGMGSIESNSGVEAENPGAFVEFILEDEANCQSRDSQHVVVHNSHPKRTVRVWLDRYYRNVPTGDRSRSDLLPGAEPEGLGCATVMNAKQEWRVVRAVFLN